jgi:RNA polymerase sigma-70 factor, ECF subfamily
MKILAGNCSKAKSMFMEPIVEGSPVLSAQSNELELVSRAQQGDTAAFAILVTKYRPKVFSRIYRIIQSQEDALELSQKTFVKVWQGIREFEGKSSFYTWLYRIASREALEWLRRVRPLFVELNADLRSPVADPNHELQKSEVQKLVTAAVRKLSPRHRAVIVLKDLEDLSYLEIAEILHCSVGTVMSRLFHARRKLQIALRPLYESLL